MPDQLTPPCEDLLSEQYRHIWCGLADDTGRYVCRRVRDHRRDFHAGRNAAGGIHQWKVQGVDGDPENMPTAIPATDPAGYQIGTVVVHPDDDRMAATARRRIAVDDSTHAGPYKGCRWGRLTGVGIHDGGCDPIHSDAVVGWPVQPLAELAVVLGHEQDAEVQRMETLHVTWRGPGGEEFHPDWCRECRVDKAQDALRDLESQRDAWWNQRAAELAELRASREAWAIEADRLDAEVTELTNQLESPPVVGDLRQRIITALSEQVSEFISPNEFGGYDSHYDELTDIALAEVQPELGRQAAEIQRLADEVARLTRELGRELLQVPTSRPAIPADAVEPGVVNRIRPVKVSADRVEFEVSTRTSDGTTRAYVREWGRKGGCRQVGLILTDEKRAELVARLSAPVSGSDTTADGGEGA